MSGLSDKSKKGYAVCGPNGVCVNMVYATRSFAEEQLKASLSSFRDNDDRERASRLLRVRPVIITINEEEK